MIQELAEPHVLTISELEELVEMNYGFEEFKIRILEILANYRAVISGHWQVNPNLHTDLNFVASRILTDPDPTSQIVGELTKDLLSSKKVDLVLAGREGENILLATPICYVLRARLSIFETDRIGRFVGVRGPLNSLLKDSERIILTSPYLLDIDAIYRFCSSIERMYYQTFLSQRFFTIVSIANLFPDALNVLPHSISNILGSNWNKSLFDLKARTWPKRHCPLCKDHIPLKHIDDYPEIS